MMFIFGRVDILIVFSSLGCFLTSLRVLYDLVSVLAGYFDPRLTFIGQGMHIFLSSVSIRVVWLPTQYMQSLSILIGIINEVASLK